LDKSRSTEVSLFPVMLLRQNPSELDPSINSLKTKRGLLYLKAQFVPRCKHFSSRL